MSIGHKAVVGAAWTILNSVGGRIVGVVATLILTRYIAPAVYGAVSAIAEVLVCSADELTRFGLLQYIVAKPESGAPAAFIANFYHVIFGFIGLGVVTLFRKELAPLAAPKEHVGDAALAAKFLPGMALAAVFDRLAMTPERILSRDLRFPIIGIARGLSEVSYAGTAITFAALGFGGWAIVYGNLVQWGLFLLILVLAVSWRDWLKPHKLDGALTKKIFAFGLPLSVGNVAHFASRKWDNIIIARYFGTAVAGKYSLAYNLADIPATHVGEHIGDVLLPSFARMNEEDRKDALVRATGLLSLLMFPMAVGLGAVAQPLTHALFNKEWASMGPMLAVLSALSVVRPIGWTIASYLMARDQPRSVAILEVSKVVLILAAVAGLANVGILWACAGVGAAFGINALLSMVFVKRLDGIPMRAMLGSMLPTLIACIPMAGAVWGVHYLAVHMGWMGPDSSKTMRILVLVLEIGAGAIVFVPSALLISRDVSREFLRLVNKVILKRGGDDDEEEEEAEEDGGEGAGEGGDDVEPSAKKDKSED